MEINEILKPIIGIPCWQVIQGYGSFLMFEFGQPKLWIMEPKPESKLEGSRYRSVHLCGQWTLSINMCNWEIYLKDKLAAHSESSRKTIEKALRYIDGQKITKVEIDPTNGNTQFFFDLGGLIKTTSYGDKDDDQWFFNAGNGFFLSIRSDGKYRYSDGNELTENHRWMDLPK